MHLIIITSPNTYNPSELEVGESSDEENTNSEQNSDHVLTSFNKIQTIIAHKHYVEYSPVPHSDSGHLYLYRISLHMSFIIMDHDLSFIIA